MPRLTITPMRSPVGYWFVFLCAFLNAQASSQDPIRPGDLPIRLKTIASWNPELDLASDSLELTPTDIVPLSDGTGRLLVATLGGTIRIIDPEQGLRDTPLLTHTQSGLQLQQESGMTAIAVHPNFSRDISSFGYGRLYTITTENDAASGGPSMTEVDFPFKDEVHQDVIREWDLSEIVGDATRNSVSIGATQSREILRVAQPGPFHNLVDLTFDRSLAADHADFGQLYITSGDGGDSKTNGSTSASRRQGAQDLASVYGNVLRINPDPNAHELVRTSTRSGEPAYSVSADNPFNGDEAVENRGSASTLAEIFAYGLRSPYRINIDSERGTVLVSDVGESKREEISIIESQGNYGWGRFEGTRQDNEFVELAGPSLHSGPLFEYGRDVGWSVIGGTVYRGHDFPQLVGKTVFADFGQAGATARLFYGSVDPSDTDYGEIFEFDLTLSAARFPVSVDKDAQPDRDAELPDRIFSLGEDANHELLLVGGQDPRAGAPSAPGAFIIRLTRGLGCDITGDGECAGLDLNLLTEARQTHGQNKEDLLFDVDWNGILDGADIDHWLRQASDENGTNYREGDTNLDGIVDFADFLRLQASFGQSATNWSQGNFDGENGTQFADFLRLSDHFGLAQFAAVPEPRAATMLVFGICTVIAWRSHLGGPKRPRHDGRRIP